MSRKKDNCQLEITQQEWGALIDIRGVPDGVNSMRFSTKIIENGNHCMTGSREDFQDLIATINEELDYQLSSKKNMRHLSDILDRITYEDHPYELAL